MIFLLDDGGRIECANRKAISILGYDQDELIGRHFIIFVNGKDVMSLMEAFKLPAGSMPFRMLRREAGPIYCGLLDQKIDQAEKFSFLVIRPNP